MATKGRDLRIICMRVQVLFFLVSFSISYSFSQSKSNVTIYTARGLSDSILTNQNLLTEYFFQNFNYLSSIHSEEGNYNNLTLSRDQWNTLNELTKKNLANAFQMQRFMFFSNKKVEISKWHIDFIVNSGNYFVSKSLFDKIKSEL